MGQRGPRPKPAILKTATGFPGRRPIQGGSTARFAPGAPVCPAWLSAAARRVWRRVVRELDQARTVATVDIDLLTAYCSLVADLAAVCERIDKDGVTATVSAKDRHGVATGEVVVKPHPLLKTKDGMLARLRQLSDSLGIGPAARSRQGAGTAEPERRPNKVLDIRDRIQAARLAAGGNPTG